ncbi:LysR family transcriptional regulator [Cognatiyoonia sp. IB215182]|uniref:LysR family transcriptional regulator n=1 Tax=Cognatiyoonia sp. IB215182 TaxID=3097353 RepID=UPI002A178A69|nr:LysR family transcriptional regulator [Cognatiyoonia sp. IB215182]MDX8350770.1 LysR family transcriptional regulator [Cognatiyoonia sp. IB215182]
MDLNSLRQFAAIVDAGGFRPAARRMGVTPSALSHAMRRLEDQVQTRLLNRNSRAVQVTEAGAALLARVGPALRDIEDAVSGAVAGSEGGTLRINAPRLAAQTILAEWLPAFHAAFPAIRIEVTIENRTVDIVEAGFDAGIRFGRVLQPDVVAVAIGEVQGFSAVASPAYLRERGPIDAPNALGAFDCIGYRLADGRMMPWRFQREDQSETFVPSDRLVLSDPYLMREAAIADMGIAYTLTAFLSDALEDGRLVPILKDWACPRDRLHIYYSGRRQVPSGLRAFIDWCKAR